MGPLALQAITIGALGGAIGSTFFLYQTTRTTTLDARWTNWSLLPIFIATALLSAGALTTQPTHDSPYFIAGVDIPSSTTHLLGTGSIILALSLSTVSFCWVLGTVLFLRAKTVKDQTWWW